MSIDNVSTDADENHNAALNPRADKDSLDASSLLAIPPQPECQIKTRRGRPLKATSWSRERTSSCGSLTALLKRKRENSEGDACTLSLVNLTDCDSSFSPTFSPRTKRTNCSTHSTDSDQGFSEDTMAEKIEQLQNMFLSKFDELKAALSSDMRKQISELKTELTSEVTGIKTQLENLRQNATSAEVKTNAVLATTNCKLDNVSSDVKVHDRMLRRNNAIVRGFEVDANPIQLLRDVNEFFRTKFAAPDAVQEAIPLGPDNSWILVKFTSWNVKRDIMLNKPGFLRDTNIYIDDDLNSSEQKIMVKARALARAEREQGRQAKVGHLRVFTNAGCMIWSSTANDFTLRASPSHVSVKGTPNSTSTGTSRPNTNNFTKNAFCRRSPPDQTTPMETQDKSS